MLLLGAQCTKADYLAMNPPDFLVTTLTDDDVIPSGLYISLTCPIGTMLPYDVDQDSNFELEVFCIDGSFQPPIWPSECQAREVCESVPIPPDVDGGIKLMRADNRTQFRNQEWVYFICEDPRAIVQDPDESGLNTWGLKCDLDNNVDFLISEEISWPECIKDTECTNFQDPTAESGLELSALTSQSVRIGEYIRYTCIRKNEFYETSEGPNVDILCDNFDYPEDKGVSNVVYPNPWPVCSPLPCVCLGDSDLTAEQALNITKTSCPSEETANLFVDVLNRTYTIPKRQNCGTFKPTDPTRLNQCNCEDLDDRKKSTSFRYILDTFSILQL